MSPSYWFQLTLLLLYFTKQAHPSKSSQEDRTWKVVDEKWSQEEYTSRIPGKPLENTRSKKDSTLEGSNKDSTLEGSNKDSSLEGPKDSSLEGANDENARSNKDSTLEGTNDSSLEGANDSVNPGKLTLPLYLQRKDSFVRFMQRMRIKRQATTAATGGGGTGGTTAAGNGTLFTGGTTAAGTPGPPPRGATTIQPTKAPAPGTGATAAGPTTIQPTKAPAPGTGTTAAGPGTTAAVPGTTLGPVVVTNPGTVVGTTPGTVVGTTASVGGTTAAVGGTTAAAVVAISSAGTKLSDEDLTVIAVGGCFVFLGCTLTVGLVIIPIIKKKLAKAADSAVHAI